MSAFQSSQLKKTKWKNAHHIQGRVWHPLVARLRGWFFVRNNINSWQIVTLSPNNCRKQRKTFRFSWLGETCSQLQPDKQLHGLQKLLVKGWDPGTAAQELGDGLHRHGHDLLHRVSNPHHKGFLCPSEVLLGCSLRTCLLLLYLSFLCSYCFYFSIEFNISLLFRSLLLHTAIAQENLVIPRAKSARI